MDTPDWLAAIPTQRPPDWRLQQARVDAQSLRLRLPRQADGPTRQLTKYLVEWGDRWPQGREAGHRHAHNLEFAEALAWHADRSIGARIDAWILTGVNNGYIADQLGLTVGGVARYRDVYYDVGGQLDNFLYIARYAVASERRVGDPATVHRRTAMKFLSYLCGPQILIDLYGGIRPNGCLRVDPATALRQQDALQRLDWVVNRWLDGAQQGEPPPIAEMEAILAAVAPFVSSEYEISDIAWRLKRAVNREKGSPSPGAGNPREASKQPKSTPRKKSAASTADPQAEVASAVRQSFLNLLSVRASPPGMIDGSGIDPSWNAQIYDAPVDAASWAAEQVAMHERDALVQSELFGDHEGRLKLREEFHTPGSPIIVLREEPSGPPTGFLAGEWGASGKPFALFAVDWQTRLLGYEHGVVMAAVDSREAAAWRRLGLAAVPLPREDCWSSSASDFWQGFSGMEAPNDANKSTPASFDLESVGQLPILAVSTLNHETMELRENAEFQKAAWMVRRLWERHCD